MDTHSSAQTLLWCYGVEGITLMFGEEIHRTLGYQMSVNLGRHLDWVFSWVAQIVFCTLCSHSSSKSGASCPSHEGWGCMELEAEGYVANCLIYAGRHCTLSLDGWDPVGLTYKERPQTIILHLSVSSLPSITTEKEGVLVHKSCNEDHGLTLSQLKLSVVSIIHHR